MTRALDLTACAARLLGEPVLALTRAPGGGNNGFYRVQTADAHYALKYYPPDERNRLGTEFSALRFLQSCGERQTPVPVAADAPARVALYSWIEGTVPAHLADDDLEAVYAFMGRLDRWGAADGAAALAPASAACLRTDSACCQLEDRLARIAPVAAATPALAAFLADELMPLRDRLLEGWHHWLTDVGLDAGAALPAAARMLSPSDFGRHNMLKGGHGLVFVDFEYFGWDDRVKMVCDFALHPGSAFSPVQQLAILRAAQARLAARDAGFPARLRALIGFFGLIWCLILLNVYLPDVWRRRVAAGQTADPAEARARQLARARAFLSQLREVLHACQSV